MLSDGTVTNGSGYNLSDYIPTSGLTTIFTEWSGSYFQFRVAVYDSNKVFQERKTSGVLTTGSGAFTLTNNGYIRVILQSASNSDGQSVIPALSVKAQIEPIQDLHGYDKPWSAGAGSNKYPIEIGDDVWTNNGSGTTHSDNDGELIINTTTGAYSGVYGGGTQRGLVNQQSVAKTVSFDIKGAVGATIAVQGTNVDITTSYQRKYITIPANTSASLSIYGNGTANTIYVKNFAITEDGSTDFTPYSNICPISGHTEVVTTVSPTTDAEDGTTYTTDLGRTVYGGTLDVVSGELVVDRAMVDLGNVAWNYYSTYLCWVTSAIANDVKKYPTQVEMITAIAEKYVVDPNGLLNGANFTDGKYILGTSGNLYVKTGSNSETPTGAFVYELATPQTIQLTPQEVTLLLGQNNIWADSGAVEVVYKADVGLYIDKKLN